MNILEISKEVKNHCLDKAFIGGTVYLSIPLPPGTQDSADRPYVQAMFTMRDGTVQLANPVQFAVQAGRTVDRVYISNTPLRNDASPNLSDVIDLEGHEIGDFTTSGIYLISAINITLTERND